MSEVRGHLSWLGILRLGVVQAGLGAIVVLVTSTLNRVMTVELALPASLPGALVALHYFVQMARPRFGHGADRGRRITPWIVCGMAVLAGGGILAAYSTALMFTHRAAGIALAVCAYLIVGLGAGAAGTSTLVLLATRVDARRRAAASTILWVMMIAGFALTASIGGRFLDPFSTQRLMLVTAIAAAAALVASVLAVLGVERDANATASASVPQSAASFRKALAQVWAEPCARRFTVFVFLSMLAYSAQELLLEPFAGLIWQFSIGGSARLSGLLHAASMCAMIGVALLCSAFKVGSLRAWTVGGCVASALALAGMASAGLWGSTWPLQLNVLLLGAANGAFAVSAIGSMMELANSGASGRAGMRMGLWGAAQAIAFALGGLFGTSILDLIRFSAGSAVLAFAIVFAAQAALFLCAAFVALRLDAPAGSPLRGRISAVRA